ncbi:MAG: hypothetical protein AABX11_01220 [Nanoarchaeota archaeon]
MPTELYSHEIGRNCHECQRPLYRTLKQYDPFPGEVDSEVLKAYICCLECNSEREVPLTESERHNPLRGLAGKIRFAVLSPAVAV